MKRIIKNLLILTAIIIGAIYAFRAVATGISSSLEKAVNKTSEAIGTKCELSKEWHFNSYLVKEYECIGPVGPHFNRVDILQNGQILLEAQFKQDSCINLYQLEEGLYLKVNFCDKEVEKINHSEN